MKTSAPLRDVSGLLEWGQPEELLFSTRRKAIPTESFWNEWKEKQDELIDAGISVRLAGLKWEVVWDDPFKRKITPEQKVKYQKALLKAGMIVEGHPLWVTDKAMDEFLNAERPELGGNTFLETLGNLHHTNWLYYFKHTCEHGCVAD